ncbi:MAG TPA: glycosyltransferase family 2 protein [Caulobacteraceae bacterium]|jgi:hypothetical protein
MRTTELLPTRGFSASTSFDWNGRAPFVIDLVNSRGDILFHAGFRLPDRQIVLNRQVGGAWGRPLRAFHEPRDRYALRLVLEDDRLALASGPDLLADVTGSQFTDAETDLEVSSIATAGPGTRWAVQDHEMLSRLAGWRGPESTFRGAAEADHKVLAVLCEDVLEASRAPHVLAGVAYAEEVWAFGREDGTISRIDVSRASPVRLHRAGCELEDFFDLLAQRPGILSLLNLPSGEEPPAPPRLPTTVRSAYSLVDGPGGRFPDPRNCWRAAFHWSESFPLTVLFGSPFLDPHYLARAIRLEGPEASATHPLLIKADGDPPFSGLYESPSVLRIQLNAGEPGEAKAEFGNLRFKSATSALQALAQARAVLGRGGMEFVAIVSPEMERNWGDVRFSLASDRIVALHDGITVDALFFPRRLFIETGEALAQQGAHSLTLRELLSYAGIDVLDDVLEIVRPQSTVARLLRQALPRRDAGLQVEFAPAASSASLEEIRRALVSEPGLPFDLEGSLEYLTYAAMIGDVEAMTALVQALHEKERDAELVELAGRVRRSPLARLPVHFDFVERLRELGFTGLSAAMFPLTHEAPTQRAYEIGFDCLVRLGEFEAARQWRALHQRQTDFVPAARAIQPERLGTELILAANQGEWAFVAERRAVTTQLAEANWYFRSLQIMADVETGAYGEARAGIAAFIRSAGETWETRRFSLRIAEETGDARGRRQALDAIRKHEPELTSLFQPDSFFEVHGEPDRFAETKLSCICVVRNEMYRLPDFLRHYRALGVTDFAFIDNMSTDGSFEYLAEQDDVVIFRTPESYKASRYGVSWHNQVAKAHMSGQWVLTVDSDELLVFPGQERMGLPGLCEELDRGGHEAFFAPMIDMYSDKPLTASGFTRDKGLIEHFPFFDGDGYHHYWTPACGYRSLTGGLRGRVFWNFRVKPAPQPPVLNKTPLVKFGPDTMYFSSTHEVSPRRMAPQSGALLHFKFLPDFHRRAIEEVRRQEHFAGAREYEIYMNKLQENPHSVFMYEGSVRYTGVESLVAAGLVRTGPRDNPEPAAQLTPVLDRA